MTSKLTAALLLLGTALTLPAAANAQVQSQFFFTGTFADGSQSQATLTLVDYNGGELALSNFVNFTYTSASLGTVPVTSVDNLSGAFTNVPGPNNVLFQMLSGTIQFISFSSGFWEFDVGTATDFGNSHVWDVTPPSSPPPPPSAVPEPAAWALMVAGFALTGVALRARRHPAVRFA